MWAILRVCCIPGKENFGCYHVLGACLGGLETHVVLSNLWSVFCKWAVINVTPVMLKNEVLD